MDHLIDWGLDHATDVQRAQKAQQLVDAVLDKVRQPLTVAVVAFFEKPLSPSTLMALDIALLALVRQIGRQLLQSVLNACEPEQPHELPKDLWFECNGYRRCNQKTANRHVASRFGQIVLMRRGYRSWQSGDGSSFPIEMLLGLNQSATPALVDWITLRQHRHGFFEVATAATISVYDRGGKRLTTMYLAWPPELGRRSWDRPRWTAC